MSPALKTRLIGATVLVALAVIIVPMFFSAEPPKTGAEQSISLDIPPAPDREMQTRTLSVAPPADAVPAAEPQSSDHLATVTIPSRRPRDVHPEQAPVAAQPSDGAPIETQASTSPTTAPATVDKPPAATPASPASDDPGRAAQGNYQISMGAYANRANAEKLVAGVRKLGYPVAVDAVTVSGKPAVKVLAGPFDSRAAAEAARLKIKSAMPRAPLALLAGSSDQKGDAPAKAAAAHRAGGWAVQIGAYSSRDDAIKLRDQLRAGGFDGFVDDVMSDGKKLWRVRVGPQTQRDDAVAVAMQVKKKMKLPVAVVSVP